MTLDPAAKGDARLVGPRAGEGGVWLGATIGAVGLLMTALVLARGGGYYVVVPRLALVVPLAIVGVVCALATAKVGGGAMNAVTWLGVIALSGLAWNVLTYSFKFHNAVWSVLIPRIHPVGVDFRDGLYHPATIFSTAHSGWPPLTLLLGKPFTLVSLSTGYAIQAGILVVCALGATALSATLAMKVAAAPRPGGLGDAHLPGAVRERALDAPLLGLVMGLWLFTSYGFMYEVERGNIDLYALVLSLLAVWAVVRSRSPWLPALLLAAAIGLKLYPAILLVVLLWRYRGRALLPAIVTTAGALLAAGPANLRSSVSSLDALQGNVHAEWWGQTSATAMSHVLRAHTGWAPSWIGYPLIVVPLALWAVTMVVLLRRGWSERGAVLAAAACVPPMAIVPAVSNDYKLVLCVFPLAVLAVVLCGLRRRPALVWATAFGVLAFVMIFLARSTMLAAPSLQGSKYALLVVLQALLLWAVLADDQAAADRAEQAVAPAPAGDTTGQAAALAAAAAPPMTAWNAARARVVRHREQVLYLVVGLWNTIFGYATFAALFYALHDAAHVSKVPASVVALVVATVIGVVNNYVLYRTIVFRSHGAVRSELPRFLVVYAVALAINLVVLPVALRTLPFSAYAVQAVYTASVVAATYVANKYFSFAPRGVPS
jgi:putative flippase GtrA